MVLGPERGTQTLEGVPSPTPPLPLFLPSFIPSSVHPASSVPSLSWGWDAEAASGLEEFRVIGVGGSVGKAPKEQGVWAGGSCGEGPVPLGTAAPVVGRKDVGRGSLK